ncbi:MAG: TIGR02710 family CRISPR-associated CARF protein, partial [Promethearchaeota archaeon]
GIIFTVGFSPEPIILNILANEPEYSYFIYTKESEHCIDAIIRETALLPSRYQKSQMPRDSAADSYRLVKKALKFLTEEKNIPKADVGLDPTGGTKIMSVGCGIAASVFDLDILYINNKKYNKELRRPEPGSEVLVRVPNPFDIYQDDKIYEGLNYLNSLDFALAREIFNYIKFSSTNPLFPEFLGLIGEVLYHWDSISYGLALYSLSKVRDRLKQLSTKLKDIRRELLSIFNGWERYLSTINAKIKEGVLEVEKISPLLIFDIKQNADREFYKSNYNNAALKYYRTIEMINQYILRNRYNLNTQEPDYSQLPQECKEFLINKSELISLNLEAVILDRYNKIWEYIYEKQRKRQVYKQNTLLPRKLGLIAGLIMRAIFGDAFIDKKFIFEVLTAVENRNNSIFAHGIVSISKKNCESLKKSAERMLQAIEIDSELKNFVFTRSNIEQMTRLFKKII